MKEDPCDPNESVIPSKDVLNNQINHFNTTNPQGIHLFALYIKPPNTIIKSGLPGEVLGVTPTVQDVVTQLRKRRLDTEADKLTAQVKELRVKLKDQLNEGLFGAATDKILIFSSGFRYTDNDTPNYVTISDVWFRGANVSQMQINLKKAIDEDRFYSRDKNIDPSGRRIENAVLTSLAFLKDPVQIDLSLSCTDLMDVVSNQAAKDFLNDWCAHVNSLPNNSSHKDEIKRYVIATAQYIDKLDPAYNYDPNHPDHTIRFGWADGALSQYTAAVQSAILWREFLAKCIDRADSSSNNHKELGVWFRHATLEDYKALSMERRFKLLKLQYENRANPDWKVWKIWDDDYVKLYSVKKILGPAYDEHSSAEIQTLLQNIKNENGLVNWIFQVADGLYSTQQQEEQLINFIIKLAIKAEGYVANQTPTINNFSTAFNEKTFIWDPAPWYSAIKEVSYIKTIDPTSGDISIEQKLLESCTTVALQYSYSQSCTYETKYINNLDPFELVAVSMEGKMNFLSSCGGGNNGCLNQTILMPAFAFAWIVEKKADDDAYEATMTTIDVVSLLIGGGELMLAIKAGTKAKRLLAGWSLASDVLDITLSSSTFENFIKSKFNQIHPDLGDDLYDALLVFSFVNSAANGYVDLMHVDDAVEGVAAYRYIEEHSPNNFNNLSTADKEALARRVKDTEDLLENSGKGGQLGSAFFVFIDKVPNWSSLTSAFSINTDLAKKLADIPGSSKLLVAGVQNKINTLPAAQIQEFLEDLAKGAGEINVPNLQDRDLFRGLMSRLDEDLIDAWSFLRRNSPNVEMKLDASILLASKKLVRNPKIANLANTDPTAAADLRTKLRTILDQLNAAGASCITCPTRHGNKTYMKNLADHIADLDQAVYEFIDTPGFRTGTSGPGGPSSYNLINEMASQSSKAKGAAWVLDVLVDQTKRQKAFGEETIEAFEFKHVTGTNARADVVSRKPGSTVDVYNEFKNWGVGAGLNSSWAKQFTETLSVANDWEHLREVFFKHADRWTPTKADIKRVLESFHANSTSPSPLEQLIQSGKASSLFPPTEIITDVDDLIAVITKDPYFDSIIKAID
ncbi:MAG: hypothetical protein HRU41_02485 [Saprospiraceae bacterium]|nr:hypothetical protein [Saprospiraceae bacterium]